MSTEANLTHKFLRELERRTNHDAVVMKFNDRSTAGLQDAEIAYRGRTVYMEFKRRRAGDTEPLPELLKASNRRAMLQLWHIWRLDQASQGRAFIVLFEFPSRMKIVRVTNPRVPAFEVVLQGAWTHAIDYILGRCA